MLGHFFPLRKAAKKCRVQLTAGLAVAGLCGGLLTQAAAADGATITWGGLSWGVGIATNFDIGGSRVNGATGATIVNNIVRLADTTNNVGISFVLESHYFFGLPEEPSLLFGAFRPPGKCTNANCTEWAWGPFVAIEIGDGSTAPTSSTTGSIAALAMGMMLGLHHPTYNTKNELVPDKTSWNFGIGLRVDPAAQVLGAGFVANQPPPAGETSIRLQKEPRVGVMLLSSFSF